MMQTIYRGTWAEVDLNCIERNILQMKKKLPQHTEVIAVVKANGYGHGSVQVAKRALKAGAKALAVALLEEALVLRAAEIKAPILVLGWVSPKYAPIASKHDITLTFFQAEWLDEARTQLRNKPLKLHMKWDTGMGRIGIRTEDELRRIIQHVNNDPHLSLTGIYTHFATADASDLTYFYEQKKRFDQLLRTFKQLWPHPVMIHIANSAAAIRFPKEMHNYIRFGISMYGLYPSKTVRDEQNIELAEAFSLHSKLIHVKKVPARTSISYGKTFTTNQPEWIGTIPIGYGDGWIRKLQGFKVLVNGKKMPIVGRICMDQTMILLDQKYALGTKVTLIGEQYNERIKMDDVADHLETINYEIPCMINSRVPRIYK